jgi:hypothetical protein
MNNIYLFLLAIIGIFIHYILPNDCQITLNLLNNLMLLSSIFFGFYIVGLSIFMNSKFVANLYNKEVVVNGFKTTLLHQLIKYYEQGIFFNLLSLFYFVILIFYTSNHKDYLLCCDLSSYLVIPLFFINIILGGIVLNQLIKVVKQDIKTKNNE